MSAIEEYGQAGEPNAKWAGGYQLPAGGPAEQSRRASRPGRPSRCDQRRKRWQTQYGSGRGRPGNAGEWTSVSRPVDPSSRRGGGRTHAGRPDTDTGIGTGESAGGQQRPAGPRRGGTVQQTPAPAGRQRGRCTGTRGRVRVARTRPTRTRGRVGSGVARDRRSRRDRVRAGQGVTRDAGSGGHAGQAGTRDRGSRRTRGCARNGVAHDTGLRTTRGCARHGVAHDTESRRTRVTQDTGSRSASMASGVEKIGPGGRGWRGPARADRQRPAEGRAQTDRADAETRGSGECGRGGPRRARSSAERRVRHRKDRYAR